MSAIPRPTPIRWTHETASPIMLAAGVELVVEIPSPEGICESRVASGSVRWPD